MTIDATHRRRRRRSLPGVARDHAPAALCSSSFGAEDMVLTRPDRAAMRCRSGVLTLDTGRLPEETHTLIDRVRERYGLRDRRLLTRMRRALEAFVAAQRRQRVLPQHRAAAGSAAPSARASPLARALAGKRALDHGPAPRTIGHAQRSRRRGIRRRARHCPSSTRWPTGARPTSGHYIARQRGPLQRAARSRLSAASAARRARAPIEPGEDHARRAAGGGRTRSTRNAACIAGRSNVADTRDREPSCRA